MKGGMINMTNTITMKEIQSMDCDTFHKKDNSPRGCDVVSKFQLKVGDEVVIENYFRFITE